MLSEWTLILSRWSICLSTRRVAVVAVFEAEEAFETGDGRLMTRTTTVPSCIH